MSLNQPAVYKNNPLTRAMDHVSDLNRSVGARAGARDRNGVTVESTGQAAPDLMQSGLSETGEGGARTAPPVDPAEAARLEAEWRAQTGQQLSEKNPVEAEVEDGYDAEDITIVPHVTAVSPMSPPLTGPLRPGKFIGVDGPPSRLTAAELAKLFQQSMPVRPDFTKLESVDLRANEVTVGGVRFPLSGEARADIAKIVVRVVRESIMRDLEAALGNEVQPVPEAGGAGTVGLPAVPDAGSPQA